MGYDVFISYEVSDSSLVHELTTLLHQNGVTCYLDCVSSGVPSRYIKEVLYNCKLFVFLVRVRYLHNKYTHNLLSFVIEVRKQVLMYETAYCTLPADIDAYIAKDSKIGVRDCDVRTFVQDSILHVLEQLTERGADALGDKGAFIQHMDSEQSRALSDSSDVAGRISLKELFELMISSPFKYVYYWWYLFELLVIVVCSAWLCCFHAKRMFPASPPKQEHTMEEVKEGIRLCKLGSDYYYGRNGISKDRGRAVRYYEEASKLGNVEALYNIGMCLKLGEGCEQDLPLAVDYFYQAAKYGYDRGFDELKRLAESGVVVAQYALGICYEHQYCTRELYKNAVYWFYQAAKQGHCDAQFHCGWCYYYGKGVDKNVGEALIWFKKAAQQGHAEATNMVRRLEMR